MGSHRKSSCFSVAWIQVFAIEIPRFKHIDIAVKYDVNLGSWIPNFYVLIIYVIEVLGFKPPPKHT